MLQLGNRQYIGYSGLISFIVAMPILIITFPVLVWVIKAISAFHKGEEWKKLKSLSATCEFCLEKYPSMVLQGLMVLWFARLPSNIQIMSALGSLLMFFVGLANFWY